MVYHRSLVVVPLVIIVSLVLILLLRQMVLLDRFVQMELIVLQVHLHLHCATVVLLCPSWSLGSFSNVQSWLLL